MNIVLSYPVRGIDRRCTVSGFFNSDNYFVIETIYALIEDSSYEVTCLVLFELQEKINEEQLWKRRLQRKE